MPQKRKRLKTESVFVRNGENQIMISWLSRARHGVKDSYCNHEELVPHPLANAS
jgi:hypothetical protein